jgi:hypothetical protein
MPDSAYAEFIEDCRRQRASLIGLIEAMENGMLGPGQPMTAPASVGASQQAVRESLQHALADLEKLIAAYEANPDG